MSENKQVGENLFDQIVYKVLTFLQLTSGMGLIGMGGFIFIYNLISGMMLNVTRIEHQQFQELLFIESTLGLVIVGLGLLLRHFSEKEKASVKLNDTAKSDDSQ